MLFFPGYYSLKKIGFQAEELNGKKGNSFQLSFLEPHLSIRREKIDGMVLMKAQSPEENSQTFSTSDKCERCGNSIVLEKAPFVSYSGKKVYFCDKCFKAVYKFDKKLKPISKIWEEGGKKFPFVVRKGSWHGSTYTVVKQVKESGEQGKKKMIFLGDLYLRGTLEKQDQPVGKPDAFIWVSWSKELADQHKDD